MIDTVILKIPWHQVTLPKAGTIDAGRWSLQARSDWFEKHVNNPTAQDKATGEYFPRLTSIRRDPRNESGFLKVEFSAPKLLFNNNLEELEESDFPAVISTLQSRMKKMGVYAFSNILENAEVAAFHPSKNFLLADGHTASYVIRELSKVDLPRSLDMSKVTFTNDGKGLQFYSAAHSLVFYDKVADLSKPRGRATDKDQTKGQKSLFDLPDYTAPLPEILRMEVRLSKKQKMQSIMLRLGFTKEPTFRDVFKKTVCQSILKNYWHNFAIDKHAFILDQAGSPQATLRFLSKQRRKPKESIYLLGLHTLCRDSPGVTGLRTILAEYSSPRQWFRISKDIRLLNELHQNNKAPPHGWRQRIAQEINDMKPLHIKPGSQPVITY